MAKNLEHEIRFYFSVKDLPDILQKMQDVEGLRTSGRTFEKTIQYEHPCKEFSFYQKSVDGRFRFRETRKQNDASYKLSWKRRLPKTTSRTVNREEEIELTILPSEAEEFKFIIEKVLHLEPVESYERYRTIFENDKVEVAVDEYPFGVAIEIEAKKSVKNPEKIIVEWTKKLELNPKKAFRLSWDDKYHELCQEQRIKQLSHVTFGAQMPKIL